MGLKVNYNITRIIKLINKKIRQINIYINNLILVWYLNQANYHNKPNPKYKNQQSPFKTI